MPKEEPTIPEQINTAIEEVRLAMLKKVEVDHKLVEINREKTAAHYTLQKAKERLNNLDLSL